MASAKPRPQDGAQALKLVANGAKRLAPEVVEVNINITNTGNDKTFVPCFEIPGSTKLATLQVLYFVPQKGWASIGPFYDVPPDIATAIKPGQVLSVVHRIPDPSLVVLPGDLSPRHKIKPSRLGGVYKIRISYYGSETEWNQYLEVLRSKKMPKKFPQLHYVESEEFTISPAK